MIDEEKLEGDDEKFLWKRRGKHILIVADVSLRAGSRSRELVSLKKCWGLGLDVNDEA